MFFIYTENIKALYNQILYSDDLRRNNIISPEVILNYYNIRYSLYSGEIKKIKKKLKAYIERGKLFARTINFKNIEIFFFLIKTFLYFLIYKIVLEFLSCLFFIKLNSSVN